jgi:hypothetical protein
LRLNVDGYVEPLPVLRLTGIELTQSDVAPVLTARLGSQFASPYPCWPNSTLEVGDNKFVVGEIENLMIIEEV